MKHAMLAVMAEANDGTEGSAAASATGTEQAPAAQAQDAGAAQPATAQDIADTSGDEPGKPPGAHLDAPAAAAVAEPAAEVAPAAASEDEYAAACAAGAPRVALVGKYSDRVPVQLKSRVHLERLIAEHGAGAVEVQS